MDLINEFLRKYKVQVLLGAIFLVVLFGSNIFRDRARNTYNSVDMRVTQAVNKDTLNSTVDNGVAQNYLSDEGGLDINRITTDKEVFEKFLNQYLVWSNASEFNEQKGSLCASYGLKEDSEFVRLFYPRVVVSQWSGDSLIDKLEDIGESVSISFGEIESHVLKIDADKYSYLSLVPITMSCDEFSQSADFLIFYTVDARGYITNLSGSQCSSVFTGDKDLHGVGLLAQEEQEEVEDFEEGDVLGSGDTGVIVTDVAS